MGGRSSTQGDNSNDKQLPKPKKETRILLSNVKKNCPSEVSHKEKNKYRILTHIRGT